jgi:hypothetical protein
LWGNKKKDLFIVKEFKIVERCDVLSNEKGVKKG